MELKKILGIIGILVLAGLPIVNAATTATTLFVFNVPTSRAFTTTYGGSCTASAFFFNEIDANFDPDVDGNASRVKPRAVRNQNYTLHDYNTQGITPPSAGTIMYYTRNNSASPPTGWGTTGTEFNAVGYTSVSADDSDVNLLTNAQLSFVETVIASFKLNTSNQYVRDLNFTFIGASLVDAQCTLPKGTQNDIQIYFYNNDTSQWRYMRTIAGGGAASKDSKYVNVYFPPGDANVETYIGNDNTFKVMILGGTYAGTLQCLYTDLVKAVSTEYQPVNDFCQSSAMIPLTVQNTGNTTFDVDGNFASAFTGADRNLVLKVFAGDGTVFCGSDGNGLGGWESTCSVTRDTLPVTTGTCKTFDYTNNINNSRLADDVAVSGRFRACFSGEFNTNVSGGDHNGVFQIGSDEVTGLISLNVTTSKTSGPAPLAVFFDANDSTSTLTTTTFEDITYTWNFNDTNSGDWNTTRNSKNIFRGPLAAHVFETPGVYDVNLEARDIYGNRATKVITITVLDADSYWSGTNTVCFSTSGTFTGCPSGALNVATTTYDNNYVANGRRLLYRAGERFTQVAATFAYDIDYNGPGMISSFGTGAKPIIDLNGSRAFRIFPNNRDWRIVGMDFNRGGDSFLGYDTLILRNVFRQNIFPSAVGYGIRSTDTDVNTYNNFIVDNNFGPYGLATLRIRSQFAIQSPQNLVVMGNYSQGEPTADQFPLHVQTNAGKLVVSNNQFIYGQPQIEIEDDTAPYTTKLFEISDNNFWTYNNVQIALGNNVLCTGCTDALIERNRWDSNYTTTGGGSHITIATYGDVNRLVVRNNIFKRGKQQIQFGQDAQVGNDWTIANNVVFYDINTLNNTSGPFFTDSCCGQRGRVTNLKIQNNIVFFESPGLSDRHTLFQFTNTVASDVTETNNIFYDPNYVMDAYSDKYINLDGNRIGIEEWNTMTCAGAALCGNSSNMLNPLFKDANRYNFQLNVGSPAIDSGIALSRVLIDFNGIYRVTDYNWDRGAFEDG